MKGRFISIEDVLDPMDTNRVWYLIPNYNGYQISNDGYVRSMKHYKKYPFGILIRPTNGRYNMSDNNNNRVSVSLDEIWNLVRNDPYKRKPVSTLQTDISSHNQRCCVKKSQRSKPLDNETLFFPKFRIIDEKVSPIEFNYKGEN